MDNPLSFHDRQHLQRVLAQQQSITRLFNRFIDSIAPDLRKWADGGRGSVWAHNGAVERTVERELEKLRAQLTLNMEAFGMEGWKRSELKNEEMISRYIQGMAINTAVKEGLFARNTQSAGELRKRIEAGMNLSARVWNLADETKTQLEFYLDSGISIGQSAATISQDIRQLLNNPDARFHRIRNAAGRLVQSKPMMNYNPGPGVYKSACKNALRVAATETNMAYRKADNERWQKLDFVLGYEIKRSGSHKGGCVICDAMLGEYPKEFVFTGFHPWCMCLAVPLLMDHSDFAEYLLNDTLPQGKYITELPPQAVKCMEQYKYSFTRAPYEMKKNYTLFDNNTGKKKPSSYLNIGNQAFKNPIQRVEDKQADPTGIYKILTETENQIRMNKKFETGVVYDKQGNVLVDKRGESYSVSFTNDECLLMKDAIMTHNHPRGWGYPENSMQRIGNSFSKQDIYLAIKWDLTEMRAVTPNYTFIMKRPEGGWGLSTNEAIKAIDRLDTKIHEDFQNRIENGTTTIKKASTVHYHRLWKELSQKYGWLYSKKKTC